MPLVALMKQQCAVLERAQMRPIYVCDRSAAERCVSSLTAYSHLFLTPEMLTTAMLPLLSTLSVEQRAQISHSPIFVDESHCIVKW